MKGQTTIPLILWVIILLIILMPLLPVLNTVISGGTAYMDPLVKLVALLIPFMIVIAIVLIPFNMNRIWNFAFGDNQERRGGF